MAQEHISAVSQHSLKYLISCYNVKCFMRLSLVAQLVVLNCVIVLLGTANI